jgi:YidC/Oxa1 family membrane protein insertase
MWDTLFITPSINILLFIYNLIGRNFGLAIILFTILIKLITHPLTAKQIKSSKALTDLQNDKEWLEIQKKYKNDKNKLAEEQMRLYKQRGVSPFASCLPTLIQLPIIIGLYQSIIQTMGNAPLQLINLVSRISPWLVNTFSFIPWLKDPISLIPLNSHFLWMDLGKPERLYIPGLEFSGSPFGIPVLAILVVVTSYFQSKLMSPPSADPQSKQMSGMMNIYMPLLMGWFAFSFASGLALYFFVSNIIGVIQYALLGRINLRSILPAGKSQVNVENKQKVVKTEFDQKSKNKK